VLYGCRNLWWLDVGLSPATSASPTVCCITHTGLPRETRRKVGMTSSQHDPYVLGYTHATMAGTTGCETARWSESLKAGLSSDRRLQLAYVKPELLVTDGQEYGGEYVPGPSTHRPSRHESWHHPQPVHQQQGDSRRRLGRRLGRSRKHVA